MALTPKPTSETLRPGDSDGRFAACLVFLETQYDGIVARLDRDTLEGVVAKTLAKMSTAAIELARARAC